MDEILRGLARAVNLICTADPAVLEIIWLSLLVTGLALAISTLIGVPAGAALGLWSRIRVRNLVTVLLYTGMGLPPVVVGLAVYLLLSRSGPLGSLGWLFTPSAMVLAQIVIALPVVAGLTMTAVQSVEPGLRLQVRALGATPVQELAAVLLEARIGVMAA
ncbi:MAG: ABC transporter permease, partial [Pirellulaceae bacterium]|nr:ABC transporter permease [Pirellulaceae bacterium]